MTLHALVKEVAGHGQTNIQQRAASIVRLQLRLRCSVGIRLLLFADAGSSWSRDTDGTVHFDSFSGGV